MDGQMLTQKERERERERIPESEETTYSSDMTPVHDPDLAIITLTESE